MKIIEVEIDKLVAYERNPRRNDMTVDAVMASISEFGFTQPLVITTENIIVVGHTRLKAAIKLGLTHAPCLIAEDLTPEQIQAYRILDNRIAEKSEWDLELLQQELAELPDFDFEPFDVEFPELEALLNQTNGSSNEGEQKYTTEIKIPPYEKSETKPDISEIYQTDLTDKLLQHIAEANIPGEIKNFLQVAAQRHTVFNYSKIADFYAHSEPEVQTLMEDSALVIVDLGKAIASGWVKFSEALNELFDKESIEEDKVV